MRGSQARRELLQIGARKEGRCEQVISEPRSDTGTQAEGAGRAKVLRQERSCFEEPHGGHWGGNRMMVGKAGIRGDQVRKAQALLSDALQGEMQVDAKVQGSWPVKPEHPPSAVKAQAYAW